MELVAACFCARSFAKGDGPSIEPFWRLYPRCPECGRDRPVMDKLIVPIVLAALRLVDMEKQRGKLPFQMDCLLEDLRKAVSVVDVSSESGGAK